MEILQKVEGKTPETMQLRARSIESMGILIASIADQNQFVDSVKQVTETLFTLLVNTQFTEDDPQQLALKDTLAKIAYYLKVDFQVIAPKYLDILIKDASTEIKVNFNENVLPTADDQNKNSFDFKIRGMESNGRISLNTSELEQKV